MGLLDGILGEVLKGALNGNVNQQQHQHLPDIFGEVLKVPISVRSAACSNNCREAG